MYSTVIDPVTASTGDLVAAMNQIATELALREVPESVRECMDFADDLITIIDQCEEVIGPLMDQAEGARGEDDEGAGPDRLGRPK